MSFAAIRLLIAKAPGWVWLVVLSVIAAALLYAAGARHQAKKDHGKALADSVTTQRTVVATVKGRADTAEVVANVEEKKVAPLRQRARAAVTDTSNHVPLNVVALVDSALTQDSTTIARKDTVIAAKNEEIAARVELDTLTEHQVIYKPPESAGHSALEVAKDVAIVVVIVEAGLKILRFFH
jgi:hypothetical protein